MMRFVFFVYVLMFIDLWRRDTAIILYVCYYADLLSTENATAAVVVHVFHCLIYKHNIYRD